MNVRIVLVVMCAMASASIGCSQKLSEKLSGAWTITALTCDTADILSGWAPSGTTPKAVFGATTMDLVVSDADCTRTSGNTLTYDDDGGASIAATSTGDACSTESCDLGAAGSAIACEESTPGSDTTTDSWSVAFSGGDNTVTISSATSCDDDPDTEETLTFTATRD